MGDWLPPLILICFSPPEEVGVISHLIYLQKAAVKSDIHMPLLQQLFISSTDFLLLFFLLLFFLLLFSSSL